MPLLPDPLNYPLELEKPLILANMRALGFHEKGSLVVPEDINGSEMVVLNLLDESQLMR